MKKTMMLAVVSAVATLSAAPVAKLDPVAEGYPAWRGLSAKTYVMGREIGPSDLRHKATVVVEVDPDDKLQENLILAGGFVSKTGLSIHSEGVNWETREMPRNVIVVISSTGTAKDHEAFAAALKYSGNDTAISQTITGLRSNGCSVYDGVTFDGAPDSTGKRPFVYVMGPEGKEPLYQGQLTKASVKDANAAITKALKQIDGWENKWQPFYGNIPEPKFHPQLAKALEKGKPLAAVEKAILKDVVSKDEEKAKEAQVLYDALNQTRNDLVMRIKMEARACPHRAVYDLQELIKYWPAEKKRLEAAAAAIKANPEADALAKMFCKLMAWSKPEFTCKNAGEVKKIVTELNKMKKTLEKLKESKIIEIQNGALLMDAQVDELIAIIPTKVPEK